MMPRGYSENLSLERLAFQWHNQQPGYRLLECQDEPYNAGRHLPPSSKESPPMPATPLHVKIHLGIMMFLQFAINGIWTIPLVTYLKVVGYRDPEVALAYTTLAWAAIAAPLFVGMIADRFFAAEKVLAVLNLAGGVLLYLATLVVAAPDGSPRPVAFFWVLLGHCVCYMPTWSLTSAVALAHVRDPGREFPLIRVMGTIGWIAVSRHQPHRSALRVEHRSHRVAALDRCGAGDRYGNLRLLPAPHAGTSRR